MTVRSFLAGEVFGETIDGEGAVVLGLHGWGRSRKEMAKYIETSGRPSLIVDLPGFGSSPLPPDVWGAADYADAIAKVAEADGRGPYAVVGHSFGGRVGVCLAAARPDLVHGLVLVGAPLLRTAPAKTPALSFRLVRVAHRIGLVSDTKMEALRQRRGSADYVAATGVMRQILVKLVAEEYPEELAALRCPVGFCWGVDDTEAPVATARRAAEMVPNLVDFDVVPRAGHDVHLSHPEAVTAVLERVEQAAK